MRKIIQTWDLGDVQISLLGPSNKSGPKTGVIEVETLDDSFRVDITPQTLYGWVSIIQEPKLYDALSEGRSEITGDKGQ